MPLVIVPTADSWNNVCSGTLVMVVGLQAALLRDGTKAPAVNGTPRLAGLLLRMAVGILLTTGNLHKAGSLRLVGTRASRTTHLRTALRSVMRT